MPDSMPSASSMEGGGRFPCLNLGILKVRSAVLVGKGALPVPVALVGSRLGAFVTLGAHLGRCSCFDELLGHELHRTADEVERIVVFQHGGDFIEGRLV